MKLTKKDILEVREIVEDGIIVEEFPHIKAIRLERLREVLKELKQRFCYEEEYYRGMIDELFGEVMIENESH